MSEPTQLRTCRLCAEALKPEAIVCPHCRHVQKKWSFANPILMGGAYFLCWVVFMVGVGVFLERLLGAKESFAGHESEIRVVQSNFSCRSSGTNVYMTVVGTVTNTGELAWKDLAVEAQFQDASGRLIDAIQANPDYRGVALLPKGQAAFKIEGRAARPQADYTTHSVSIRWAKDPRAWP